MMVHCQSHLSTNNRVHEDIETYRFTSITRKENVSFVIHPDSIALVSLKGDMNTTLPANSGLAENFKVAYSLAESFKKSVKRGSSLFDTLRKVSIGTLGTGTPSPLLEHRT